MSNNKKLFLDYSGLLILWNKIKNTFANKIATEESFNNINNTLNVINTSIDSINTEIDALDANFIASTPKEANNYSAALSLASNLIPGTIISVKSSEIVNGAVYVGGFYIVDSKSPVSIKYIGTSSGSSDEDLLAVLEGRIDNLEKYAITSAVYTDGNYSGNFTIENNQLIVKYDDKFVANSESINALTHKAIATKFGELESLLTGIPKFDIKVVDYLPESNISTSTIYLVKNNDTTSNNLYTEYIYIDYEWEKLGEQSLDVSNFITNDKIEEILAGKQYTTKGELVSAISDVKNEIFGSISNSYVKSNELEDIILNSIIDENGKIGKGMTIPISDIENLN